MKKLKTTLKILAIILIAFVNNSCEKIEPGSIILSEKVRLKSAVFDVSEVTLEWTKPYIRNLSSYYVMRSETEPGPLILEEQCYIMNGDIYCYPSYDLSNRIKIISDPDELTFVDTDVPVTDELYYWVVAIGDTTIMSNVMKVEIMDVKVFDLSLINYDFDEFSNKFYFIGRDDENEYTLNNLDVESDEIIKSKRINSNYYNKFDYVKTGDTELLLLQSYSELITYNPVTFELIARYQLDNSINNLTTDNLGHIFVSTNSNIYVLSADDLSLIQKVSSYYVENLYCYNGVLLAMENSSYADYSYFTIAVDGSLTQQSSGYINTGSKLLSNTYNSMSGMLIGSDGKLYNHDLAKICDLNFNNSVYDNECTISEEQNRLVVVTDDYYDRIIDVYSLSGCEKEKSYYPIGYPVSAYNYKNEIIVISRTENNSYSGFFIEHLDL